MDDVAFHWRGALPRAPEKVVRRERLHAAIEKDSALIVIQGPAGFGKTTAVSVWANTRRDDSAAIIWMDAKHSTSRTFWSDLASAFTVSGIILDASAASPYAAILSVVHVRSSELTIILDRFDTVADREIQDGLHELIARRRGLKVIVCVRRNDIFDSVVWSDLSATMIRARDLAFNFRETAELAQVLGAELDEGQIRAVHAAGQGWPEPTRALTLELGRAGPGPIDIETVSARVARDYLRRRLVPEFEMDERLNVIFATALPDSVTEELTVAVSGDERAACHLRRLEEEGVLTTNWEGDEFVYRWLPVARAALREEFERRQPQRVTALHSRLASWYFDRRAFAPALRHALKANDLKHAVQIIEHGWPELLKMHMPELDVAFAAIPHALIATHPQAAAVRDIRMNLASPTDDLLLSLPDPLPETPRKLEALARSPLSRQALGTATAMMIAMRMRGRLAHALRYADKAELIGRVGRFHQPDTVVAQAPNSFLQVGITRGLADDLPRAIEVLRFAYELAPASTSEHVSVDAAGKIALFFSLLGSTKQALIWLDRHDRPYSKSDWMARWVSLSGALARTLIAIDRLDRVAATDAMARVEITARVEQSWSPFVAYTRARYALQWGDRLGALALVRQEKRNRAPWLRHQSTMQPLLDAVEADLLIALGLANQAERLLTSAPHHSALDSVRARFALLSGQPERALRSATAGLARTGTQYSPEELLLIAASAEGRLGNTAAARELLRHALDSVGTTGTLRPLMAIPRHELTALIAESGHESDVLDELGSTPTPFPRELRLVELTEREQVILERIAEGMSTQAVADDLFVSRNTVKTQVRNLYLKLGVKSRDGAVARAHEFGLLATPAAP
ncbi:LuxR C-terminal-related transcriptional regulator [Leifsonia sp. Root112D2]|uniref:LuxR C-terminal-related transcriptional regulator n=1 Tax=Leifsonia sp. Root112D2 TaxID=1736426 RepID=UPI00138F541F|nr:LuxR C-terminal-related transcriptional regulator [Leifsonia sp. Root112D2]